MSTQPDDRFSVTFREPAKIIPLFKPEEDATAPTPDDQTTDYLSYLIVRDLIGRKPQFLMDELTDKLQMLANVFGCIDPTQPDVLEVIERRGCKPDLLFYAVYRDAHAILGIIIKEGRNAKRKAQADKKKTRKGKGAR